MTETTKMIKAIANDSKVRIDRIVANYEQLEKENAELKEALKGKVCKCMIYFNFKDLEKENAELKARVSEQSERINELTQELDDKINRFG